MITDAPNWDLSDLFSSIDDPKIFEQLNATKESARSFHEKYNSRVHEFAEPSKLLSVLKECEEILLEIAKTSTFAELVFSTKTSDSSVGAFLQRIRSASVEISSELIFFEIELSHLPEEKFESILNADELKNYRHYLERLRAMKPHLLSEKEEKILEFKSLTSNLAFDRLFEQETSRLKFDWEIDGEKKQLNESEILNLLQTCNKQVDREKAAKLFTKGLLEKSSLFCYITNILAEDKKIEDNLRKFQFPEEARHLSNETTEDAVETMVSVVEENYNLVQEYYKFKKQVLALENIYDYDRYAPLKSVDKKISFNEAKETILKAFHSFAPYFGKTAAEFFDKRWIDAGLADGKRGGAYCMAVSPEIHPYVFMNYTGSINDLMTLAHELGHAINFELARKQTPLNYRNPLTLSETASIFAESLAFKELTEKETDKENLLAFYMQRIESIFASVHRQISMFRFEQDVHHTYREKGELSVAELNAFWRKRQQKMFGDSIVLTPEQDNWWMYIPHFIGSPFYVYAYAFGELFALGLLQRAEENKVDFPERYKEFMETVGSKSPTEIAKIFDVDFNDPQFWRGGMKIIEQYLQKAKKLYEEQEKVQ